MERDFETMVSKRALRGAAALALTLSLFAAPAIWAADAPAPAKGAVAAFWAGIEGWLQSLVTTWFGPEEKPTHATSQTESLCMEGAPSCPGEEGGGPGGVTTTDEGSDGDPNG